VRIVQIQDRLRQLGQTLRESFYPAASYSEEKDSWAAFETSLYSGPMSLAASLSMTQLIDDHQGRPLASGDHLGCKLKSALLKDHPLRTKASDGSPTPSQDLLYVIVIAAPLDRATGLEDPLRLWKDLAQFAEEAGLS